MNLAKDIASLTIDEVLTIFDTRLLLVRPSFSIVDSLVNFFAYII